MAKEKITIELPEDIDYIGDPAGHFYNALCVVTEYFAQKHGMEYEIISAMLKIKAEEVVK